MSGNAWGMARPLTRTLLGRIAPRLVLAGIVVLGAACDTSGATWRTGVGDRLLDHPPWYAGTGASAAARILVLPVAFQRGAVEAPMFEPGAGAGSAVAALLSEMNDWLEPRAVTAGRAWVPAWPEGMPPDVQFGCPADAAGDCVERGDSALGRRGTTMRLALHRPSAEWITALARMLDSAGASHALLVTLEVGHYWVRQSGLLGNKSVELGQGNTQSLPWLTSLETPVSVLQLTGALVNREGRGVRIGAEGIRAFRTALPVSAIGGQRLISEEDVEQVRKLRRQELPGQPTEWSLVLCRLVTGLGAGIPCP